ncbi:MAG: hypothetical protein Q8Q20_03585 [bacterium]|nr:hypothetical protein [bacterium]
MTTTKQILLGIVALAFGGVMIVYLDKIENGGTAEPQYSARVNELCRKENKVTCVSECVDGWRSECYYDSRKVTAEEAANASSCFAYRYLSQCGSCDNDFSLRQHQVLQKTSCEEFYTAIDMKNEVCDDCLAVSVQQS